MALKLCYLSLVFQFGFDLHSDSLNFILQVLLLDPGPLLHLMELLLGGISDVGDLLFEGPDLAHPLFGLGGLLVVGG